MNYNTNPFQYSPAELAVKLDYIEYRLYGLFDRIYDRLEAIDRRMKVLEAVITPPVVLSKNKRSRMQPPQ